MVDAIYLRVSSNQQDTRSPELDLKAWAKLQEEAIAPSTSPTAGATRIGGHGRKNVLNSSEWSAICSSLSPKSRSGTRQRALPIGHRTAEGFLHPLHHEVST
jgi:hypothetical protein